jgi:hypothetical protein
MRLMASPGESPGSCKPHDSFHLRPPASCILEY